VKSFDCDRPEEPEDTSRSGSVTVLSFKLMNCSACQPWSSRLPLHVPIRLSFRPEVEIEGQRTKVLVEQLGAMDPSRLGESYGLLALGELREVDRALAVVVGHVT